MRLTLCFAVESAADGGGGRLGPEGDDVLAPDDCVSGGSQVDAVDAELAGGNTLLHSHRRRVHRHQLRRHREVVVQALVRLPHALALQPARHAVVVVILGDVKRPRRPAPAGVEPDGHRLHAPLVAAAVAQ